MELGLKDKTVLVTGGAGGIGTAISRGFAREGCRVAITYFEHEKAAQALVEEIKGEGAEAVALSYDLSDLRQADRVVDDVVKQWGRLDVLVGNAVRWPVMPEGREALIDNDMGTWAPAVRTNLEGTTALVRSAAREMAKRNYGRIVVVSTEVSEVGRAGATAYGAAKAGLRGMVASLRWEVGPHGVLVNLVSPGFNMTPRNLERFPDEVREQVRVRTPTGRLSTPEDPAPLVVFLGSLANTNMTGEFISVSGGAD